MKKGLLILFSIFISINLFSQNLGFSSYLSEDGDLFYVKEGIPYLYNTNIPGEVVIDKNGFKHVLFNEE